MPHGLGRRGQDAADDEYHLGDDDPDGDARGRTGFARWVKGGRARIAFPTPQQLAELGEEALAAAVRAGYRNAYLYELAARITSGELDLEAWLADDADDRTLYKRLRSLKGFGDYAVSSLMRIYGRFGYLSIDTVARACYKALHPAAAELDSAALDATIRDHYATHGRWQALMQWVDVIRAFEEGLVS